MWEEDFHIFAVIFLPDSHVCDIIALSSVIVLTFNIEISRLFLGRNLLMKQKDGVLLDNLPVLQPYYLFARAAVGQSNKLSCLSMRVS